MSAEEAPTEWKTIRISATIYYKLLEMSGILTALLGSKIAMSTLVEGIIIDWYDRVYPIAKEKLMNPDEVRKSRKKWKEIEGEIMELLEIFKGTPK